jgi:hypothetical protein
LAVCRGLCNPGKVREVGGHWVCVDRGIYGGADLSGSQTQDRAVS